MRSDRLRKFSITGYVVRTKSCPLFEITPDGQWFEAFVEPGPLRPLVSIGNWLESCEKVDMGAYEILSAFLTLPMWAMIAPHGRTSKRTPLLSATGAWNHVR